MMTSAGADLQAELEEQRRFETLVSELSSQFMDVRAESVDQLIEEGRRSICTFLELDHCTLWQASADDPNTLVLTHYYRSPDLASPPHRMNANETFRWALSKLQCNEVICLSRTADAPLEAEVDKPKARPTTGGWWSGSCRTKVSSETEFGRAVQ
jgi:hypothetical protein